jgi:hypothetical protein
MRRIVHPATLRRSSLLCNDWILAAADFEFVAVRVFKKEPVIAGAVVGTDFRSFQSLPADLSHESCNSVYVIAGVALERNPGAVWLMISIFSETEKLRRLVRTDTVKCSPRFIRAVATETERGQQFAVKLSRAL